MRFAGKVKECNPGFINGSTVKKVKINQGQNQFPFHSLLVFCYQSYLLNLQRQFHSRSIFFLLFYTENGFVLNASLTPFLNPKFQVQLSLLCFTIKFTVYGEKYCSSSQKVNSKILNSYTHKILRFRKKNVLKKIHLLKYFQKWSPPGDI